MKKSAAKLWRIIRGPMQWRVLSDLMGWIDQRHGPEAICDYLEGVDRV